MRRYLVSVLALLALALCAHAQNPATGFPPYGSFDRGQFDTVNLQDLNFNFAIPIATSPGRGMDFNFAIVYNSLNWAIVNNAWTPVLNSNWGWQLSSPTGQVSYKLLHGHQRCGFIDGVPAYIDTTTYNGYQYVDPLGTIHAFSIFYRDQYNECTQIDTITATYTGYATDGSAYHSDISRRSHGSGDRQSGWNCRRQFLLTGYKRKFHNLFEPSVRRNGLDRHCGTHRIEDHLRDVFHPVQGARSDGQLSNDHTELRYLQYQDELQLF